MASRRVVLLSEILAMLEICAPDSTVIEKPHHYHVSYQGKSYPSLPKGEHGSGARAEIMVGKVKHMVRLLGIDEACAYEHLGLPVKKTLQTRITQLPRT